MKPFPKPCLQAFVLYLDHGLSEIMAEMLYNPTKDLLEQPLSDFFYYVLRLSELLRDLTRYIPLQLPDDCYGQFRADGRSIMVHQARFSAG